MPRNMRVENDSTLPKQRKRRKPMSEEQKKAAAERLAKAREKRLKENPPEYKSIHPEVLKLGDDHAWSHINVKKWIKTQKDLLKSERANVRANVKGAAAKASQHEGYIRNMERYLRDGVWLDLFWGEYQQNKCKTVCLVMAYNPDGTPKRNVGTWYPDISCEWTREMEEECRGGRK
jgi:hypothetical protein